MSATAAGEVRRVVSSGVNGETVTERTPAGPVRAFVHWTERLRVYGGTSCRGRPCVRACRVLPPSTRTTAKLAARGRAS